VQLREHEDRPGDDDEEDRRQHDQANAPRHASIVIRSARDAAR
jgi:hypothetical protein